MFTMIVGNASWNITSAKVAEFIRTGATYSIRRKYEQDIIQFPTCMIVCPRGGDWREQLRRATGLEI